jgi:hypothetical protein
MGLQAACSFDAAAVDIEADESGPDDPRYRDESQLKAWAAGVRPMRRIRPP